MNTTGGVDIARLGKRGWRETDCIAGTVQRPVKNCHCRRCAEPVVSPMAVIVDSGNVHYSMAIIPASTIGV